VARLRRTIERPGAASALQPIVLQDAVRSAFHLLAPEFSRRSIEPRLQGATPVRVQAEPVALEQIVHNLLMNALQALEQVPAAERELSVSVQPGPDVGVLSVADSGPGIAPELLPRIFEPFVSTREHGLGLGLSLCESLASNMGGSLQAQPHPPRGALLRLTLPAAA
jgi:C4-dicarboxylate-specific signal transduction histidine kinase